MLDRKFIRENIDLVKEAIKRKGERVDIDGFIPLDERQRRLIQEANELKHRRRVISEKIGRLKKGGGDAPELAAEVRRISQRIKELNTLIRTIDKEIEEILTWIPNIPHPSVPESNQVVRECGEIQEPDFQPLTHLELGQRLGIIDFQRGVRVSGSNFVAFKGAGAALKRALINFMLDLHTEKHGYQEVSPPLMAKRESLFATGQLPKMEGDMYLVEEDDLFLIPTAEVPLTNLHRGEILGGRDLPLCYVSYTPCFRREAGSYGQQTKGLIRIHQFDKVDLVKFTRPEDSYQELERLVTNAEEVLRLLGLPYRVVCLSAGELSFAASRSYALEVWAQGLRRYLEVSCCSNFEDFQARRAKIRFLRQPGAKPEYVHTINGSGLALPRTLIAIMENYQTDEGTVVVPEVLREYMKINVIK